MHIAYFTNQYPAVSHTFIRREIQALETLGMTITRYALKPAPGMLVDAEDQAELRKTKHILNAGLGEILRCLISALVRQPIVTMKAVGLACKMGWRSDRGLLRHFAYVAEAVVLADWCQRDAVQHIHAHFGTNSAAIALLAERLSGIPYSFTAHGPDEFERATLLSLDLKLAYAAFAICVSFFGRAQFMRWSPASLWGKIAVVHCGLDPGFLGRDPPSFSAVPRFVCVGRLSDQKAQLVLVNSVRRLRNIGIHCEVVLAGDGPMRSEIEAEIRRAGLERQVMITGWVSSERVKAEIAAARALVLPSFSENMPIVIMEALALGRPVISTHIAGIPELVQAGKSGWLVPSSDEVSLANAMREALAASTDQLAAMGAAGRAYVIEHHDAITEARKLKELFEREVGSNDAFAMKMV